MRRTIHITTLYLKSTIRLLSSRTPERLPTSTCHRRARHQSGGKLPQRRAVARRPGSTYCGLFTRYTYPHHCGPYKQTIPSDRYISRSIPDILYVIYTCSDRTIVCIYFGYSSWGLYIVREAGHRQWSEAG